MNGLVRAARWLACALAAIAGLQARERWLRAQTAHFEIFSATNERETREFASELEQFRATFLQLLPPRRMREPRTTVVAFANERDFEPYGPLYQGKPRLVAGYFLARPDESLIAFSSDRPAEQTRAIIYHEYVHLLINAHGLRMPLWANEGLAELYATFEFGKDSVRFGKPHEARLQLLAHSALMPLRQLFAVQRNSPEYNETDRAGIFYAESWALVHLWVCGRDQRYRGKFGKFLELIETRPTEAAFREAFGLSYEEMELALRAYVQSGEYYVREKKIDPAQAPGVACRPADDFERDFALLNLRWRIHNTGDAAHQALQLAERQPASPRPHDLLASIAVHGQQIEAARTHWRQAIALGSDNPYVYFRLADSELRPFLQSGSLDYRLPDELCAEVRRLLDRAVTLSPDYVEAYELLGLTESWAKQPRPEVLAEVRKTIPYLRDRRRLFTGLAVLHWRLNDFEGSRKLADAVLRAPRITVGQRNLLTALLRRLPAAPPVPPSNAPAADAGAADPAEP